MSWTNRVLWQEGMFLRAQHFQQQDRWLEATLRARVAALRPYPWGVTSLALDQDLLATGRIAVLSASGLFEDGTSFAIPRDTDHPVPLDVPPNTRGQVVFLAVPIGQAGAVEVASGDGSDARWESNSFEALDTHSGSPQPAELQVGRLRLRTLLEDESRAGYFCIGLARIAEVSADRRVSLDGHWIPPTLLAEAAPALHGIIRELSGMLNQRGEALAARLAAPGQQGVAQVTDVLLLQVINRSQALLRFWADTGAVHPNDVYAAFVQIAGELSTFLDSATKRPNTYPGYRHDDLQHSFAPVVADLRRMLSAVIDASAVAIPLQERRFGVRVGQIADRAILRAARFVLVVRADVPAETLRQRFPRQSKIGAVEEITNLVNVQLPGIEVTAMAVAPRQLPFYANATYFELDRAARHWQQMQASGGFAIHVSGEFPGLWMELWAIRGA
nr:type VI secretion system baseplate subunit TssK [uncultured Lichenicoccus sp.]